MMNGIMMFQWSFSENWLQHLKGGLQLLQIDVDDVFKRVVMELEAVPGKKSQPARVNHGNHRELWDAIESVSGDKDIGLHLGEVIRYNSGDILQYLFLSSSTFGEAIIRCAKYARVLSDACVLHHRVEDDSGSMGFVFHHAPADELRQANELCLVIQLRFFSYITSGAFQAERIDFAHPAPADTSEHQRIFGCPISFNADINAIWFPNSLLEHESLHAEPAMLRMHEQLITEQLSELEKGDIRREVQDAIGNLLDSGEVSLDKVAQRLDVKPSKLRYQLSDMGTSFNQLFADYRVKLAKQLLSQTDESIDQIVYLTGFSEPSPFYRAFKRWTGMTPIVYREKFSSQSSETRESPGS